MITPSRLVMAAVLGSTAAAICSLLPPAASAGATQRTVRRPAVAQAPAGPAVPGASSGVVIGSVRTLGGPGLAGVCVTATGPTGTVHAFTSAGGRYLLSGVRPGAYRIGFRACGQPGRYVDQQYGQPVLVAAGHPTSLRPVTLRPANPLAYLAAVARAFRSKDRAGSSSGPQISGKVTDSHGKALAGICVGANQVDTGGGPPPVGPETKTGRNGTYRMSGGFLNSGRWRVVFFTGCGNKGNLAPQWWKFAATQSKAKVLVIHSHTHLTGINARLVKGASISGTVRAGSKSGPGLPGACVGAEDVAGAFDPVQTTTGRGGKYLITGLGTGRYGVFFDPGCGNKGDFTEDPISPIVSVTDGKTTKGVDGFLPRAGEISGTVTGPDHRPLAGICVEGRSDSGDVGSAFDTKTGPTGQYAVSGLVPGSYEVDFAAGCGSKGSFAPQSYKNQVSELAANPVLIKAGTKAGGIDAVMQPGGIVTGTVTSASGKKLAGVCVLLDRQFENTGAEVGILIAGDGTGAYPFGAIARTVAGGRYRVTDLPPGNYAVSFASGCARHEPAQGSRWFSPQGGDRMSLLTVGTGTVSGVNAKLPAPGTITGIVTGPTGKPAAGICVFPEGLTGEPSNVFTEIVTDANPPESNKHGVYRLTGLAAGKYGLEFFPCQSLRFASQWYRQATEFSGLTPVVVRSGHVNAHVNEKMVIGQSVSGRIVKAGSSHPVARACVTATDNSGNFVGFAESRKDGSYTVGHLAAGGYSLQVGPCIGGALANVVRSHVKVGSSKPLAGINVPLPVAGRVTGLVTGGSPALPVGGVCVTATPKTGAGVPATAFSTFAGRYSVGGLAPGKYRIEFSSLCVLSPGGFVSQWFDGKATRGLATPVGVAAGKTTGPVDATLAADGAISGSVRASGSLKAGVCVLAFPKTGGQTPTVGVTDAKGTYLIGGLAPGRYVVEFAGGCGVKSYRTQWFNGSSSRNGAQPVVVKVGRTTANINAH